MPYEEALVGRPSRLALLSAIAALLLIGPMAGPALAHITASTQEDPDPGTQAMLEISFDHGCAGEPTTELAVQLPDAIDLETVEPLEEDGWRATLDDRTVTWTGGEPVPDHVEHTFRMRVVLPDEPGGTVPLPTIQRCEDDRSAWIQIPDEDQSWSELEEPAPVVTLTDQPSPASADPDETEDEAAPPTDDGTPIATPEAEEEGSPEAFLTDDEPAAAFPIIVLAVLAGLAVLATIAVVAARRGGQDDPSA